MTPEQEREFNGLMVTARINGVPSTLIDSWREVIRTAPTLVDIYIASLRETVMDRDTCAAMAEAHARGVRYGGTRRV